MKERKQKKLEKIEISEEIKKKIKDRIKVIEETIEKEASEENMKNVMVSLRELGKKGTSGEGRTKMWKILNKN